MPILNYTTKVDVYKTLGEIQADLVKHVARKIMTEYDEAGSPKTVCFEIMTGYGLREIQLPARAEAVKKVLEKQKVKCDYQQACRVAWRIVKDWVESQMAILEAEMVSMDEILLPYMVDRSGRTVFENYIKHQSLLEEGKEENEKQSFCAE